MSTDLEFEELVPYYHKVMNKIVFSETGCWNYDGYINPNGYGVVSFRWDHKHKKVMAHRFMYEFYFGIIPPGMTIDHLCQNTLCCNPEHLECVTNSENARRGGASRPPKTHCKNGHEFTEENTLLYKYRQGRECRACKNESGLKSYYKNKALKR